MAARGRVIVEGKYDPWLAFFRDPDGNSLALLAEAPRGFDPVRRKLAD